MTSILQHLTVERNRLQAAKNEALARMNASTNENSRSYWFVQQMIAGVSLAAAINAEETIMRMESNE